MTTPVVWIVDDDPLVHFITKKMIRDIVPPENVISFSNGKKAFEHISDNANTPNQLPDIVLLDINMPYMNGIQFLESFGAIKPSLSKNITIYIVTSSINKTDINTTTNNPNVKAYINKPLDKRILQNIIKI